MRQTKLTSRSLAGLPLPSSGRQEYRDDKVSGLSLRVSSSGHKSWVLYYRHRGRLRRLTLGTLDAIGLADARDAAKKARAAVVQGEDPAAEKRGHREALTFGALTSEYLERHAKPKKRSWRADEAMLRTGIPPMTRLKSLTLRSAWPEVVEVSAKLQKSSDSFARSHHQRDRRHPLPARCPERLSLLPHEELHRS